jgi:hypothetical protein
MVRSRKIVRDLTPPPAPRSHWPVVVGSFLTGVAAMTLVGVVAPTIAAARAPQVQGLIDPAARLMTSSPEALIEITEAQQRDIEARLAAAEQTIAAARSASDAGIERLRRLERR